MSSPSPHIAPTQTGDAPFASTPARGRSQKRSTRRRASGALVHKCRVGGQKTWGVWGVSPHMGGFAPHMQNLATKRKSQEDD